MFQDLLYSIDPEKHYATITLNRPHVLNALSRRIIEELSEAFQQAADDSGVKAILLVGAGHSFCAGHDRGSPEQLEDLQGRPRPDTVEGRYGNTFEYDLLLRLRDLPKPTIAAVQGNCIFAGWTLASAMDVIFAAEDARFLSTHMPFFMLPWDLGVRRAKHLLFRNSFFTAQEAFDAGFVSVVTLPNQLRSEAESYVARVAENDSFSLRMVKQAINDVQDSQGFRGHMQSSRNQILYSVQGAQETRPDADGRNSRAHPLVATALTKWGSS